MLEPIQKDSQRDDLAGMGQYSKGLLGYGLFHAYHPTTY